MLLVMKKDVMLDPVDVGVLSSDAVMLHPGYIFDLSRGVWAGAGFYYQIRVYGADLRMNTCSVGLEYTGRHASNFLSEML
jgi:hypothetical protein